MDTQRATKTRPVLLTLPAAIDITNANDVRDQITAAIRPGVAIIIADLSATTSCDSQGRRALLQAHRRAAANGTDLRLLKPTRAVRRLLELTGMDRVLAIYTSREKAMSPRPAKAH
jgi:anti-anti-sigma factor